MSREALSPDAARETVAQLLTVGTDDLYEMLGIRASAARKDWDSVAAFSATPSYDVAFMGPLENLRAIGRRYFAEVNRQCYQLICSPTSDADRGQLTAAIAAFSGTSDGQSAPPGSPEAAASVARTAQGRARVEIAAILAATIATHLPIAPAVAAVIAALVVRLFLRPLLTATCAVWGDSIGRPEQA